VLSCICAQLVADIQAVKLAGGGAHSGVQARGVGAQLGRPTNSVAKRGLQHMLRLLHSQFVVIYRAIVPRTQTRSQLVSQHTVTSPFWQVAIASSHKH
jgi:hypothetical protein